MFAAGGYIAGVLEWTWLAALCMPSLLSSDVLKPMQQSAPKTVEYVSHSPSLFDTILVAVVTMSFVALTAYIMWRLPRMLTKTASKALHVSTDFVIPKVVHKKRIAKKRLLVISTRTLWLLKLVFVALPPLLTARLALADIPLQPMIIWTVMGFLAACACVLFGLQWFVASIFKLDYTKLR